MIGFTSNLQKSWAGIEYPTQHYQQFLFTLLDFRIFSSYIKDKIRIFMYSI